MGTLPEESIDLVKRERSSYGRRKGGEASLSERGKSRHGWGEKEQSQLQSEGGGRGGLPSLGNRPGTRMGGEKRGGGDFFLVERGPLWKSAVSQQASPLQRKGTRLGGGKDTVDPFSKDRPSLVTGREQPFFLSSGPQFKKKKKKRAPGKRSREKIESPSEERLKHPASIIKKSASAGRGGGDRPLF